MDLQKSKTVMLSQYENLINRDIRGLTIELNETAKHASYFLLYEGPQTVHRDDADDRLVPSMSGDMVVFVFTDPEKSGAESQSIDRVVGYFRTPERWVDISGVGPIKKFEVRYDPSVDLGENGISKIEELYPKSLNKQFIQVAKLSRGLNDGSLFYNADNHSIVVNGQIFHGSSDVWVHDVCSFTISPEDFAQ